MENNSESVVPFNRSAIAGREMEYITEALQNGQVGGDQRYSRQSQALLESLLGVPRALITTSCTHALEICSILLNIHPGDEVIVPSFTFVSTANAFALRGAKIVFCDVRPDTLNMDETRLEALVTTKTKAIVPVHYAGVGCEMDAILKIARSHEVPVVEDNAHGLCGKYKGRWLGTFGCLATQSFHETKNITCGEGGAVLINEPELIERAEILREKGTNRSNFFRGMVDKYTWVDIGSSYVMSDVLAAFLYGQLEQLEKIQQKRKTIWESYDAGLRAWSRANGVTQPVIPPESEQAYHMYYLLLPSLAQRQAMIAHLKQKGISAVFHYLPLHSSPMGQKFGGKTGDCPVTESVSDRLLRLPFYNTLDDATQARVIEAVLQFKP
jgi:dTDP-4-amino-4,6-dideoxygalactose transaminase